MTRNRTITWALLAFAVTVSGAVLATPAIASGGLVLTPEWAIPGGQVVATTTQPEAVTYFVSEQNHCAVLFDDAPVTSTCQLTPDGSAVTTVVPVPPDAKPGFRPVELRIPGVQNPLFARGTFLHVFAAATVPALVGMSVTEAQQTVGKDFVLAGVPLDVDRDTGLVVGQKPGAGTVAAQGSEIHVTVILGVRVPDLRKDTVTQARSELESTQLLLVPTGDTSGPADRQDPPPDTLARPGSRVTVHFAAGPPTHGSGGGTGSTHGSGGGTGSTHGSGGGTGSTHGSSSGGHTDGRTGSGGGSGAGNGTGSAGTPGGGVSNGAPTLHPSTPNRISAQPVAAWPSWVGQVLLGVLVLAGTAGLARARGLRRPRHQAWVQQHVRAIPGPSLPFIPQIQDVGPGRTLAVRVEPHRGEIQHQLEETRQ